MILAFLIHARMVLLVNDLVARVIFVCVHLNLAVRIVLLSFVSAILSNTNESFNKGLRLCFSIPHKKN